MPCWPCFFAAAQDMVGVLGCEGTLLAHGQLLSTKSFWQGCAQFFHLPASTGSADCHDPGADHALGFVEPHEVLLGHCSSPSESLWIASRHSDMLTTLHSLMSSINLMRVHVIPLSTSLMKILKSTHSSTDPSGQHSLLVSIQTLNH